MKKEVRKNNFYEFAEQYHESLINNTNNDNMNLATNKFDESVSELLEKYGSLKKQRIVSDVKNFYETASLAGEFNNLHEKNYGASVLFIDKGNIMTQVALFKTFLMKICNTKEKYISLLFGLKNEEVLEALDPKKHKEYLEGNLDKEEFINIIKHDFDLNKLKNYIEKTNCYDKDAHYNILTKKASSILNKTMNEEFDILARNYTDYMAKDDKHLTSINNLIKNINENEKHILANNEIYSEYNKLISNDGSGNVKFLTNINITTKEGINKLEEILLATKISTGNKNRYPFDIAVIPNLLHLPQETVLFIKGLSQEYVISFENEWLNNSSATLHVDTYENMGAQFIIDERENRVPLTNLSKIKAPKGIPFVSFISGADHGNIYHSEVDTQNMIEMAIANNVKTVYIKGLFYSTYYRSETARRRLVDPSYPTLDSRLKKAREVIKQINDAGIKVEYIMGSEEENLFEDLKRLYLKEQGVKYWDFMKRDDLKVRYSWVEPFIIQRLIPYMIRSGEDVVNFHTDEEKETRVSKVCEALKLYYDGLPLGQMSQYINPKYLKDTAAFKVNYSTIVNYNKKDPSLSVEVMEDPNFSSSTQYANPTRGAFKKLARTQTGAVGNEDLEMHPQIIVDPHQGYQHLEIREDQVLIHTPQMINDEWYDNKDFLPGIKNKIKADPTKKRVSQLGTNPNYPGGWMIAGDVREWLKIVPYYKRTKEVMNHVQKTGKGLPETGVLYINDTQLGSLTERIEYFIKTVDIAHYLFKVKGILFNGDFQQGWNYPSFPLENRHLGTSNVSQQMIDFVELIRPWMIGGMGVVNIETFENNARKNKIDSKIAKEIIIHLLENNLIEKRNTKNFYANLYGIKNDIDYNSVDLKLPHNLKIHEAHIRKQLKEINKFEFIDIAEGNHEYNTDWNNKGYRLVLHLKQELDLLKEMSGSDVDIVETEFFTNKKGDLVRAPYGFRTINGYNTVYGHSFKAAGKSCGNSPIAGMAKYFEQVGALSNDVHRALGAHYHIIESGVINNKLFNTTGGFAGQSGYEHRLGYNSSPASQIDVYLPDGRIEMNIIGKEFIDNWKIKNPYVAKIGLENFINECFTEYAYIYGDTMPNEFPNMYPRQLEPAKKLNKTIGPKIK